MAAGPAAMRVVSRYPPPASAADVRNAQDDGIDEGRRDGVRQMTHARDAFVMLLGRHFNKAAADALPKVAKGL